MADLIYGCQTYTWQMSYETYSKKMDHILDVIASSGEYRGIEPEVCMLGPYTYEPERFSEALALRKLELGALCLVCDWLQPRETDEEKREADRIIDYLKVFPGTLLALVQMPGEDRENLEERQKNCISCCRNIATRALNAGITTVFHPNSPEGSVFRVEDDYRLLLDSLDTSLVGFAPDAGHVAKGGMDVADIFRTYAGVIKHVHYKDMLADGTWAEMGKGSIDFLKIAEILTESGYSGWIMIEDESPRAEETPDEVTQENAEYLRRDLK